MQFASAIIGLVMFVACNQAQRGPPPQGGQGGPPQQGGQGGPPSQGGQSGPPSQGGQSGPPSQGGQSGPPSQGSQRGSSSSGGPSGSSSTGGQSGSSSSGGQSGSSSQGGRSGSSSGQSGQSGNGGSSCSIDGNSATLPACILKFFKDGILIDGNNNTCNSNKPVIAAKLTLEQLFVKAEAAVRGSCSGEPTGGPGRKKRQGGGGMTTCSSGSGTGVGNCETGNYRLQSIRGIKDMGSLGTLIVTNGVPDHCYKDGAEKSVNLVCEHYRALLVPKNPTKGSSYKAHSMGPVGIAVSGAFLYNHLSAESSCNAAAITEKPTFDTCDGHASPGCQYHYHKAPNCIPGYNTCGLLGYTNDGIPFYGKCSININNVMTPLKSCYKLISGKNGCDKSHYNFDRSTPGCNLDEANGYYFGTNTASLNGTFLASSYAYFFTPEYPFSMPGYYGNKASSKWCVISL